FRESRREHSRPAQGAPVDRGGARPGLPLVLPRHPAVVAHLAATTGPAVRTDLAAVPAESRHAASRNGATGLRGAQVWRRGQGAALVWLDFRDRPGGRCDV